MRCFLCTGKGKIRMHENRYICGRCFSQMIEKRIRKNARVNRLFSKGDRILVVGKLNKYLIKSILKELPVKIFYKERYEKGAVIGNKINKIVLQWTLDDEINEFVRGLFEGKRIKKQDKRIVKLLLPVTDREAVIFCGSNRIRFKPNKKDADVQRFLDRIEKEHHNIKFNILKNLVMLNRLDLIRWGLKSG